MLMSPFAALGDVTVCALADVIVCPEYKGRALSFISFKCLPSCLIYLSSRERWPSTLEL